jgi:predicted cupin superfamily sugar epimerase
MDAAAVIAALDLSPHPEGGLFRQTWADDAGTAIYFLLRHHEQSDWHRVRNRAEIWHFYAGAPLELQVNAIGPDDGPAVTTVLGTDLEGSQRPQAVVPADAWQRARTLGDWSLVGCTVSPPFTFAAFELAAEVGSARWENLEAMDGRQRDADVREVD